MSINNSGLEVSKRELATAAYKDFPLDISLSHSPNRDTEKTKFTGDRVFSHLFSHQIQCIIEP